MRCSVLKTKYLRNVDSDKANFAVKWSSNIKKFPQENDKILKIRMKRFDVFNMHCKVNLVFLFYIYTFDKNNQSIFNCPN